LLFSLLAKRGTKAQRALISIAVGETHGKNDSTKNAPSVNINQRYGIVWCVMEKHELLKPPSKEWQANAQYERSIKMRFFKNSFYF